VARRDRKSKSPPAQHPVQAPRPSAFGPRLEAFGRNPLAYAIVSALLLLPCFWQSRIHAGDLSSHVYNAWLAQLIQSGKMPGLEVVPRTTNVMFDLMLSGLLRPLGADWAQRIAVSASVLVFFWGAFYFVSRLGGCRAWAAAPMLAILAYGWTFHMGFFNMYLSLGFCLAAVGAAWDGSRRGLAIAAGLLVVAYIAHGLPVAWTIALAAYTLAARRAGNRLLPVLLAASAGAIVILRLALDTLTRTRWHNPQILSATGGFQALIYGEAYLWVGIGLMALWAAMIFSLWRTEGRPALLHNLPFHFAVLTAAGIVILPTAVAIPGYQHGLVFIAERMSLALGVCYCAVGVRSHVARIAGYAAVALALLYFGLLYRDNEILNELEDRVTAAARLLPGKRVVSGITSGRMHVDPISHMIDRACLGTCYSYANYEPSTGQFRVRAVAQNPFVAFNYGDSYQLQVGDYVVKPSDLPLYSIGIDARGQIVPQELRAGEKNPVRSVDLK
jgi:hypothetical protein